MFGAKNITAKTYLYKFADTFFGYIDSLSASQFWPLLWLK